MARQSTIGALLYVLFGPVVWAAHFTLIYGAQAMLCALAAESDPSLAVRGIVAALSAVALALLVAAALQPDRIYTALGAGPWPIATQNFQRRVMVLLMMLSLFGVVASAATASLPVCAALR